MSLTLDEARARAATVSDVAYDVDLDLTDRDADTYAMRTTVSFAATGDTFLELTGATDLEVSVDGTPVEVAYDGRRIPLTGLGGRHEVTVSARVPYVTDGDGMHTFTDPADGETYVSAYTGMDVCQRVFACFDQNDVKAPVTLAVSAPPEWTVLANGRGRPHEGGRWTFATTPPIPAAMFVVCAGPWHSRTWEHAGLPFGWHARRSLAADLDRDLDELRATTEACFDHYTRLFDEPYPFDSYDQAFVPGQNWGALETPGCVTYRDEYLPREVTTEAVRGGRMVTIAHEMCHMWFGDLVTMTWWEDTWLQESFADMFGYRVAAQALGRADAPVRREAARKVTGYDADQRRSTHPVAPAAEDVPDVDAAAGNFDMISYAKGNAVLHQLVVWLGEETFLRGVNTYLARHRFGNATLADFISALDEASDRDVHAWVEVWLRRSGFDTVRVTRDGDVPVLTRDGERPHRLGVTAYDEQLREVGRELVDLAEEPVRLDAFAGRVVVPNSHGETFARMVLDDASWAAVSAGLTDVADPLTRAVLWTTAAQLVRSRDLAALDYVDLVTRHVPAEQDATLVRAALRRTVHLVLPQRLAAADVPDAVAALAGACRAGLDADAEDRDADLALAFAEVLALTCRDAEVLHSWLDADAVLTPVRRLPLNPSLRWSVVRRLAETGAVDAAFVETERRRDPSFDSELGATAALAARPTREAKEAAWATASDPAVSNRHFEAAMDGFWSLEQVELLAPYVDRYLAEAPAWATRGQAFAQVVGHGFPQVPLTPAQVGSLADALGGELPQVLRRKWEDRLDDLR